ncbi:hypothetical protein I203_102945 [Kwoniella mangroviensis CBS 8507]|uniref:uncharacterized protein n=1 Tax=Kwoniella mangroviensis CBS 8507 TaxID=1296122 RepID=UPI00080D6A02|nr:uncharacterized protein I203_03923 [Kwoniella mangroviensis CBS 8507]OCF67236.1 hypothetical protein I203_03923 [Kwoniella mangroviensis CBS 8507]
MAARKSLLLICDVQERFRSAIYGFDYMKNTICKMMEVAKILKLHTLVTEQNPKALGSTIHEITNLLHPARHLGTYPKTKFSMITEGTKYDIDKGQFDTYIVTGIESHVCVLQTTLDLLKLPTQPEVFVLADAVSSCNKPEIAIALRRMELAGAKITTSESMIFELLGDANNGKFKQVASLIKDEKTNTALALRTLCVEQI